MMVVYASYSCFAAHDSLARVLMCSPTHILLYVSSYGCIYVSSCSGEARNVEHIAELHPLQAAAAAGTAGVFFFIACVSYVLEFF